jgi:hypothetical protein
MVHRSSWQRIVPPFSSHVVLRDPMQFVVDQWDELIKRALAPCAPGARQLGHLVS